MEKVSPKIRQNFWKLNTFLGHPQDPFSRRREEPGVIFLLFRLSWGPFALRVMKCPQLSHLFIIPVSIPVPTIRHSSSSFLPRSPPSIPIPVLDTTLHHPFPSLLPTLLRSSPLSLLQNSPVIGLVDAARFCWPVFYSRPYKFIRRLCSWNLWGNFLCLVLRCMLPYLIYFNVSKVRRTGKPGVLQSMGLQRVGHDWATEQQWQSRTHPIKMATIFSHR